MQVESSMDPDKMKKTIIASNNAHKVEEIQQALKEVPIDWAPMSDFQLGSV